MSAERVKYVDSTGGVHDARLIGRPDAEGRAQLLVSFGGAARLTTVMARYSEHPQLGTWHRPARPS